MKKFYVYIYCHPDTGIPFYIGKGSAERYKKHLCNARNPHLRNKISKLEREGKKPLIDIVFRTDDEDLSYDIEENLIRQYKRICDGGTLCNQDLGTRGSKVHDFDDEFFKLLGNVNDHEIARRYGCSHSLVSHYRRGHGIPQAKRQPHNWGLAHLSEDELNILNSKLGKIADKFIAKEFNTTLSTIRGHRQKLGIQSIVRPPEIDESLLGKDSDKNLAERFNCDVGYITKRRNELGIPTYAEKIRNQLHVFSNGVRVLKCNQKKFSTYSGVSKATVRELIIGRVKKTRSGWSYLGTSITGDCT